ncbi:MAG: MFS transporter [Acidimicrobiia bacterium]
MVAVSAAPARLWHVPGFVPLAVSSWMWHVTRWGTLFCSTYLMTQLSGAPILNQLVGASIFAPLLAGGLLGVGTLADRVSRRTLILRAELVLLPLTALMYVLVATEAVRPWMIYPFALAVGTGGLINVVSQRPMMYEIGGPRFASRALAIEMAGSASSSVAGTLLGGTIIETVGISAAFGLILVPLGLSALLLLAVPDPTRPASPAPVGEVSGAGGAGGPGAAGPPSPPPAALPPLLVSVLGVTIILNLFFAPFTPLVPVMADRLGASAFLTGVLAASGGVGQFCGGLFFGSHVQVRRGRVYAFGVGAALVGVICFALSPVLWMASLCLVLGGVGHGGFNAAQSVLVIESVGPQDRGWALGKLSMAIGCMPVGQITMGLVAEAIGAPAAIVCVAATGLVVLACWLRWRPQVVQLRSTPPPKAVEVAVAAEVDASLAAG